MQLPLSLSYIPAQNHSLREDKLSPLPSTSAESTHWL